MNITYLVKFWELKIVLGLFDQIKAGNIFDSAGLVLEFEIWRLRVITDLIAW